MITRKRLVENYIMSILNNEIPSYDLICTKDQLVSLAECLYVTKLFENSLLDESVSIGDVMENVQKKHKITAKFKKSFGFDWPL